MSGGDLKRDRPTEVTLYVPDVSDHADPDACYGAHAVHDPRPWVHTPHHFALCHPDALDSLRQERQGDATDLDRLATEAAECGDTCQRDGCVTCDPEAQ